MSEINRAACLGHPGSGRAAGPQRGWLRSRVAAAAAAGRTHAPPERRCRREVCPEGEACCPPSHPTDRVLISSFCVLLLK